MDNLEYESIKQIRFILNQFNGSNYKNIIEGIKIRIEMSNEIGNHKQRNKTK